MENVTSTRSNHDFDAVASTFDGGHDVGTTSLWGFLGPASDEMFRLYTDVSFSKFYEIPRSKIVWTEAGEEDGDVAATRVVVPADTELALCESEAAGTTWLAGTITTGYLQNTGEQQAQFACGNVTTTLVCTLAGAQGGAGNAAPLCITLYTAIPTWCVPTHRCDGGDKAAEDCGNVLLTLVCTLAPDVRVQEGKKGCAEILGTVVCTIARDQVVQAEGGCGEVLKTLVCTLGAAGQAAQAAAGACGEVLTTMVCTLAVAANAAPQCVAVTTTLACSLPADQVCATYVTARPSGCAPGPKAMCGHVLTTIFCTLVTPPLKDAAADCAVKIGTILCTLKQGDVDVRKNERGCHEVLNTIVCQLPDFETCCSNFGFSVGCSLVAAERYGGAVPCLEVLGTVVCTIGQGREQAACVDVLATAVCTVGGAAAPLRPANCGQVLTTFACTLAGGEQGAKCGNVLTTLACTLAAPKGADAAAGCKDVLWTAGCTFQRAEADCKDVLWTAGCTFAPKANAAGDCKNVLWTAGCTFAAHVAANAECKDVLWTAGCTFARAQAQCKDVLWTAGCTFAANVALPVAGKGCVVVTGTLLGCTFAGAKAADCKNVLWTAGCTFAGQQHAQGDCKNVLWTAGCTFAGQQQAPAAYKQTTPNCPTYTCAATCQAAAQAYKQTTPNCPTYTCAATCQAGAQAGFVAQAHLTATTTVQPTAFCSLFCSIGCTATCEIRTFAPCTVLNCPEYSARCQPNPMLMAQQQPICITLHTAVPTWCEGPCGFVPTIPPTHCDPQGPCGFVPTIPPTNCGPG